MKDYKRQKEELNEYIEMEQFIREETQKELRRQQIKYNLVNFHQRVTIIHLFSDLNFIILINEWKIKRIWQTLKIKLLNQK